MKQPRKFIEKDGHLLVPLGEEAKHGYALLDKEFRYLEKHSWTKNAQGYVVSRIENRLERMHLLVMPTKPKGMDTDHVNRNKVDNRRENLRFVTRSVNLINSRRKSKSGIKNIYRRDDINRWEVKIGGYVGIYKTISEAIIARDEVLATHGVIV